jgi:hypothetical protein
MSDCQDKPILGNVQMEAAPLENAGLLQKALLPPPIRISFGRASLSTSIGVSLRCTTKMASPFVLPGAGRLEQMWGVTGPASLLVGLTADMADGMFHIPAIPAKDFYVK